MGRVRPAKGVERGQLMASAGLCICSPPLLNHCSPISSPSLAPLASQPPSIPLPPVPPQLPSSPSAPWSLAKTKSRMRLIAQLLPSPSRRTTCYDCLLAGCAGGKMKGSCWYCEKEGHPWFLCYKKPDGWTPQNRHQDGGARRNQKNGANMVANSSDNNPKSNGGAEKKKERTAGQFFHIGVQGEQGDASAKVGAELHPLDYWVLDTGTAWTMTPRKELLDDVQAAPINEVCSASGHALKVAGAGRAAFKGADGKPVVLHDILLVPDLKANLISLRKLAKAGVSTSTDGARTYKGQLGNRVLWDLHESKDVYRSMWQLPALAWHGGRQAGEGSASQGECNAVGGVGVKVSARSGETDWATAHRRLGHVAMPLLKQLEKDGAVKGPCVALPVGLRAALPCSPQPRCPALRPARRPAMQPTRCASLPLGPRALPCDPRALPCGPRAALPLGPHAALPIEPRCPAPPGGGASRVCRQKPLLPQQHHEWAVRWGSPGGGAWGATTGGPSESTLAGSAAGSHGDATGAVEAASLGAFDSDSHHSHTAHSPCPLSHLLTPQGGPVLARGATVLPCPAAPSGLLTGLHLPSFAKNLVATSVLQDQWVTVTQPSGELLAIYTDSRTGEHLAKFTWRPGSGPYTPTTESALVAESGQVAASVEVVASCSCPLLTHQTLLWHHRLGHPSLPRLRGMHSCLLVSGLPMSLPPLPRSLAPPCLPCVEGRQRAAPHSSFPSTTAPLQTLHMDVWRPARVPGQGREHYLLLVVDDYTRYSMVFPLQSKAEVCSVLFSPGLLDDFCGAEGIRQTFTLPASPQHNGIAERRIRLVIEVACTSIVHAAAPLFLWPFAVQYASEQLNLWSHVSHPETSPTLRPAQRGDPTPTATVTPRCSARLAVPPGFPPRPSSLPLQPVAVDSGAVGGGAAGGADSEGVSSGGAECPLGTGGTGGAGAGGPCTSRQEALSPERLRKWAVQWGSPGGGASRSRLARAGGAGTIGATAGTGGAATVGAAGSRRQEPLSPERLHEWAVRRGSPGGGAGRFGAPGSGGAGPGGASAGVPGVDRAGGNGYGGTGAAGGTRGIGPIGASAVVPRVGGTCGANTRAGGTSFGGAVATGAGGSGVATSQPQPSALRHLLGLPPTVTEFPIAGTTLPLLFPPTDRSQPQLLPDYPLTAPVPYTTVTERREPETRASTPERQDPETRASAPAHVRCVCRHRAPAVPDTHDMTLHPSSVPQRVVLPSPPASSLPHVPDPESDLVRAASSTVSCLLTTSSCPPSVGGELALGCDVLEDKQFELECLAAAAPHLASTLLCPEGDLDALDIPTPRTYAEVIAGTYVDKVPPPGANIVYGMWIFRVKRLPGSPPAFKARYVARGFSQREGVDFFQTFSPTPKMTALQAPCEWHDTLRTTLVVPGFAPSTTDPLLLLRTDTSLPPFYVLVYVDDLVFATGDSEALALVKAELQERHTCTDLGELRSYLGLQITRDRARCTITLTQSHMVQQVLQHFVFSWSSSQPTPVSTGHSLSAPPLDESVEPSGPYLELVGCLMYLMTCTRPDLAYLLSLLARYVAPRRH
ncbi:unnamed protein product [Closterium sp. NIES-54]